MRKSFFHLALFAILIFSCSCLRKKPDFPKKDLAELEVYGSYWPENPERLEELRREVMENGELKEGETFEEKYPYLLDAGDEKFNLKGASYCYNVEKDKNPIYREDLRVRLYDKNGVLLAEDFLRLSSPDYYDEEGRYSEAYLDHYFFIRRRWHSPDSKSREEIANSGILDYRNVRAHLPYHLAGHEIRIVRMEGEKEIVLRVGRAFSKSYVIDRSATEDGPGFGWIYDEEDQCHY